MIHRRYLSPTWRIFASGVLALPLAVSAQIAPAPAEKNWREANDAVGQFKRGHADILKWEKENAPAAQSQELPAASLRLMSSEDAVRQAWRAHRELVKPMNRIGEANVDLIAQGRWTELDPMLQRRVERSHFKTIGLRSKNWSEFATPDAPVMDFVLTVCDKAAGEVCPVWPGQPMSAHWGVEDPAAAKGSEEAIRRAFNDSFMVLSRRISLFMVLPMDKLDKLALHKELTSIGQVKS